ncbi:MAG: hypothetical protein DLM73_10815 [Chthoniobacterales bacterium]|nr:MAG: hypothetical protein DLM73_10815 [Chthoniobacterales bacterium]
MLVMKLLQRLVGLGCGCVKKPGQLLIAAALAAVLVPTSARAAPGDLYEGDAQSGTIFKFTPAGAKSTFVSLSNSPFGLAFDVSGNLYVAAGGSILKFTPAGIKSVFAPNLDPKGLAFDLSGNLFESDANNHAIFKFTPAGTMSTFASGLNSPRGLAFDSLDNLYVADESDNAIFKFTPAGIKTTFASGLSGPFGLAIDGLGNLYASDEGSGRIYKFTPAGTRSTFASGLNGPTGLALDGSGNLFESDIGSNTIFKFTPAGTKSTFASGLNFPYFLAVAPVPKAVLRLVTNLNDSGEGSLRSAIAISASGDTIEFSVTGTIALTSGELLIDHALTIAGPSTGGVIVSGSNASRSFDITSGVTATISNLTISNGGILNNGTVTITKSTISGNSADSGGGIRNNGTLTITKSAISGNSATTSSGGGIINGGTASIVNSTIFGNNSGSSAGGIFNDRGTITITNSTISGNSATIGGGIVNDSGTVTITNSTISGNSAANVIAGAGTGGGIYIVGGTVTSTRNTIIAKNTALSGSPDVFGAVSSQGYNLIGNNSGATITPTTGDQIGTPAAPIDPKLGPLQDNGGPTKTQALLSGSTAIDAAGVGGPATDQRGRARPFDSPAIVNADGSDGGDIGAFEVGPSPAPVTNLNDSATGSLRDAIADYFFNGVITFDPNLSGSIALASSLQTNKDITIAGPGRGRISISGNNVTRVIDVFSDSLTLTGLNIVKGSDDGIRVHKQATLHAPAILTVNNCTISGNAAAGIFIEQGAAGTVTNSTVSDNPGTGIVNSNGGLSVTNSTFTRNTGNASAGALLHMGGTTGLRNSTISGNSASLGGGIYYFSGTLNVSSSIIAGNTDLNGNPDVYAQTGNIKSLGYNLIGIGNGSQGSFVDGTNNDQVGTTAAPIPAGLGPLQDNGGPTFTMALLSGSRALDKGFGNGLTIDQRGSQRVYDDPAIANPVGGDGADIGAFEVQPGLVANVSTRLPVGQDPNALFQGFIVQGPAGSTKKILVRALGPFLGAFGITDFLANPTLDIFDGNQVKVASNDNWKTTQVGGLIIGDQVAEINASGLAPTNDAESAIIANLAPGQYTAVVHGSGNSIGTGLVDAFDLSAASPARLVNVGTRGLVQPGDGLLTAGFIVQNGSVRVVIRAVGPSLTAFGITNALPDTTLQLRDVNGAIVRENDDWMTDQKAELEATGLQPSNSKEAALVQTIPPGQYTAQVRGKPEATGIGVVEVYFLQ